jgi:PEP-CTERM motif-containing protein
MLTLNLLSAFNNSLRKTTKQNKATVLILALAATTAASSLASTFTGLCDTGVTTGCALGQAPLTSNTADGNFTVISVSPSLSGFRPPQAADTIDPAITSAVPWYTSGNTIGTPSADWITTATQNPNGPGLTDSTALGTYTYQEMLTATFGGWVTITGDYAADNCATIAWGSSPVAVTGGSGVTIGGGVGTKCTSTDETPFEDLHPFSFQENVTAGALYYLDFEVGNTGSDTGLLVDNLAANPTPEPSSVLLTLSGLALLGGGIIRRRRIENGTSC